MSEKATKKEGPFRGRHKPKPKSLENLQFQARKLICRVARIVKVYLVRKYLRTNEGKNSLPLEALKVSKCETNGKLNPILIFMLFRLSPQKPSLKRPCLLSMDPWTGNRLCATTRVQKQC